MKIINDLIEMEVKFDGTTLVDVNKDELLNLIEVNEEELDATAKLKVIKTLFKSRSIHTKEDLIVEVTNFLHYAI